MALTDYLSRFVIVVRIVLKRCNNVYGVAPCTAVGGQCVYNFDTCEDPDNYIIDPDGREVLIQSHNEDILPIDHIKPLLLGIGGLSTELDPEFNNTLNPRLELNLKLDHFDVNPETPFDHDKGVGKFRAGATSGEYWQLLFERNPNYRYSPVEVFLANPGETSVANMKRIFFGQIENVKYDGTMVRVDCTDPLKEMQNISVPNVISDGNVTQREITAIDRRIKMVNVDEFKVLPQLLFLSQDVSGEGNYLIDQNTGTANKIHDITGTGPNNQFDDMAWDPIREVWYAIEDDGAGARTLYSKDYLSEKETSIGGMGGGLAIVSITYDDLNDTLYACTTAGLYTVNVSTGAATLVAAFSGATTVIQSIAYDPISDTLFGVRDSTNSIYSINKSTAVTALVGAIGFAKTWNSLAHNKQADALYAFDHGGTGELYEINKTTGAGALKVTVPSPGTFRGFMFFSTQEAVVHVPDTQPVTGLDISETLRLVGIDSVNQELVVDRRPFFGVTARLHTNLELEVVQEAGLYDITKPTFDDDEIGINPINWIVENLAAWGEFPFELFRLPEIGTVTRDDWYPGDLVRLAPRKPIKLFSLINAALEVTQASLVVTEDQEIDIIPFRPKLPHETIKEFSGSSNILRSPQLKVDRKLDTQKSRYNVFYDPVSQDKLASDPTDFKKVFIRIDGFIERIENFGKKFTEDIASSIIYRQRESRKMTSKKLRRYRKAPESTVFRTPISEVDNFKAGDLIDLTHKRFRDTNGVLVKKRFQCTRKQMQFTGANNIEVRALNTGQDRDYGGIAHSGALDYLVTLDREHSHIGASDLIVDGIATKATMSNGDDGFYFW